MRASESFTEWREEARALVLRAVPPEAVGWSGPDLFAPSLPGATTPQSRAEERPEPLAGRITVPSAFLRLAQTVFLHRSEARLGLLYRLLWRLQRQRSLLEDATDADVVAAGLMAKAVRRDVHKMRAFVRFRLVVADDGTEDYVAWYEPDHRVVEANAGFFVRRFAQMRWSILSPDACLHWDGETCIHRPGVARSVAGEDDPAEALWRTYYASIFNPARLKTKAMRKEMPKRFWKNLPEARLIPGLIAGAQAREAAMIAVGTPPGITPPEDWAGLRAGIDGCTRCPLHCQATRAVHGEGPRDAALMLVGEQPGDQEDLSGRPFVGPAGQLLDDALRASGVARTETYVTNAVKHFKHEVRGRMRLHQTPGPREIDHCRWWLDAERQLVKPRTIIALGASAARGILGRTIGIAQARAQSITVADGVSLHVTAHPASILRLPADKREPAFAELVRDLKAGAKVTAFSS